MAILAEYPDGTVSPGSSAFIGGSADASCIALGSAVGIPALLLIPVALATEVNIPGLAPFVEDVSTRIGEVNAELQKSVGIFNPQIAQVVRDFNAQLDSVRGAREALGVAGIIAAALILSTVVYDACGPEDGSSTSSASSDGSSES
ncbi:hypothetical protein [Corynebacterium sp.]|uniref:hypothetical protein n=1 Tax=Corynebacterium sp. TaxID=1720 RepID=UPI002A91747F|nr:hypothetical protein [Corynebacterium sp.]MDY5785081.1 hypothetical protein [Corynebacterium sp.]